MIYDSSERLMMLEHFRFTEQGSWAVLLDAKSLERRQGKDESYWPVGVSKSLFVCIILKVIDFPPGIWHHQRILALGERTIPWWYAWKTLPLLQWKMLL